MHPVTLLIIVVGNLTLAILAWVYFHKFQAASGKHVSELEGSLADEKRLERLREEFTAMMIHELRTPLTTVSYTVDAIVHDPKNPPPDNLNQYLTIIKSTTDEMLQIVNELLDVAKIEAGKFEVVKQKDDLGKLIEEKIAAFKPLIDQKHLVLLSNISQGLGDVSFDKNRLGQVIDNLLSNSIKYTDQGQINVTVKNQNNQIIISVSDTGTGLNPDDLPKLFSKFSQLGKGKNGDKKGTGLGLVVAKGIIEAHGGKIWANSEGLGHGAVFTFTIPVN